MIIFWLICAAMLGIALAFILPTLLQAGTATDAANQKETNIEVYRDQLRELDADLANGIVSAEQHKQDREEIERRLLEDVGATSNAGEQELPRRHLDKWAAAVSALGVALYIIPMLALHGNVFSELASLQPALGSFLLCIGLFLFMSKSERGTAYAIAIIIPVLAVSIYLTVGNIHTLEPTVAASNEAGTSAGIEANVALLAKRLEQNPHDADGWAMLGRSYINLEKYSEASNAYAKATEIKSQDADLLTEYAFALAMANGRKLEGKPAELLKQALQIAPENPKTLELAGEAEFESHNYKQAIADWQKVLAKSGGNPELVQSLNDRIREAKKLSGDNTK
jgi:cytochrome c-type biogenesis protein CcmH